MFLLDTPTKCCVQRHNIKVEAKVVRQHASSGMAQRVIEKLSRVLKVERENKMVLQNIWKTLNHLLQTRGSKVLKPTGRELD